MRQKGIELEDKRMVYMYSSESDEATALMADLKQRVENTKDKVHKIINFSQCNNICMADKKLKFNIFMILLKCNLHRTGTLAHIGMIGELIHQVSIDGNCFSCN